VITLPTSVAQAVRAEGTFRDGGTDQTELRHRGVATGPVIDLRDVPNLATIERTPEGGLRLGARCTLTQVATHPDVLAGYPGLAQAAGGLATPQIRARASLAGSLLQEVRCWYLRSPQFRCKKQGGLVCLARKGDARFHAAYDRGPCIAPHPSTMAVALWAFDARVTVQSAAGSDERDLPTLLGDGSNARQTHAVAPGELLTAVTLPPPVEGEHSAYHRTIHRARAEWPLVEALVRVVPAADGTLSGMHLFAGGIANRPLAYPEIASQIDGRRADDEVWNAILDNLPADADLPQAAYKGRLLPVTLRDTLAKALAGSPAAGWGAPAGDETEEETDDTEDGPEEGATP